MSDVAFIKEFSLENRVVEQEEQLKTHYDSKYKTGWFLLKET